MADENKQTLDYSSLPKKRMAGLAFFQNEAGEILIVKPHNKEKWIMPGGIIEVNESPRKGTEREVLEELSLEIKLDNLLVHDYLSPKGEATEGIHYIFNGGKLSEDQISQIKLQEEELAEYKFIDLSTAEELCSEVVGRRMKYCLEAASTSQTFYLEDGLLA